MEEVESPVNGKITVVKNLAFGIYVQVGGLTQSGSVVFDIWRTVLRQVRRIRPAVRSCLILGLGAGSSATLVRKFWQDTEITGVDLDQKIVEIGRKYFKLDEAGVKVVVKDAYNYLYQISKLKNKKYKSNIKNYDLVLIDLYVGDKFPEKFESENYIQLIRTVLARDGPAIFNRLYYGEKRAQAIEFGNKLEKIFSKVEWIYPQANLMFICSK